MKYKWLLSCVAMIAMTSIMQWQGASLKNSFSPMGVVSLEFAHQAEHAKMILSHWDKSNVNTNMLLDFFFIPTYALFFLLSLQFMLRKHQGKLKRRGELLSKGIYVAACCDVLENILMIISISGIVSESVTIATTIMAAIKFIILIQIIFYLLMSLVVLLIRRLQEKSVNVTQ